MKNKTERLKAYKEELKEQELANSTINKYMRDAKAFELFAGDRDITKELTIDYKEMLKKNYKPSTQNNKIITLNKYLKFIGLDDKTVKGVKVQRRQLEDVMTQNDFERIYRQAEQKGDARDKAILDILYFTGIRVSEMQFVTVEALKRGYIIANNKGKIRHVPIVNKLKKILLAYAKDNGIEKGPIIQNTHTGEALSRYTIFKRIKWLSGQARVKKDKAYPHSIRHLFAKNWLERNGNNILQLADILGHESLETTRIYTQLDINETRATME